MATFIGKRRKNHVNMVGHDGHAQVISFVVIVHAAIERDLTRPIRQYAAMFRNEGDEMRLVIALQMRQIATIESHQTFLL